jgi:hypothetical protein
MTEIRPDAIELPPTASIDIFGVKDAGHGPGTGRESPRASDSS